jgi:hypothetical protein
MNITHKDFIGIYEDALEKEKCNFIIQNFETHAATNPSSIVNNKKIFNNEEMGRKDFAMFAEKFIPGVALLINEVLNNCIYSYAEEFFSLKKVKARSDVVKLQRTPPRGGYHVWHCEAEDRDSMERVLTWMIYLNDIPEGEGETEFLWQGIRVKPKAGTCVIWPAQFTHPHRGNPVYSCDKYIATGWYTYTDYKG